MARRRAKVPETAQAAGAVLSSPAGVAKREYQATDRDVISLLLYLETCAVDHRGRVDTRRMNDEDHEIAKYLVMIDYIRFGRLKMAEIQRQQQASPGRVSTHWVELTHRGWEMAHNARRGRAERNMMDKALRAGEDRVEQA